MNNFLKKQEKRIRRRIAYAGSVIRSRRSDAALKAFRVLPSLRLALVRLQMGLYGICKDCGHAIPRKRLQKTPGAIRCVSCQSNYD